MRAGVLTAVVREFVPPESVEEQWDLPGLERKLESEYFVVAPVAQWAKDDETLEDQKIAAKVIEQAQREYDAKFAPIDAEQLHHLERAIMLQSIDVHWREHLAALDYLRQGIHLRGYAQKQPKQEYKREAFELFGAMLEAVKLEVIKVLNTVEIRSAEEAPVIDDKPHVENVRMQHADYDDALGTGAGGDAEDKPKPAQPVVRQSQKVGRNEPCPCGSGKKYKHCHGKHD
jgi:preprotein translocase subunit SecA